MAYLTLRTADYTQIRFLVDSRITLNELSNAQIDSDVILGTSSDHVFESLVNGINTEVLTGDALVTAINEIDNPDPDVDTFIADVLNVKQQNQFIRAVVFRAAGLAVQSVRQLDAETTGVITHKFETEKAETKQMEYFRRSESEIRSLRDDLPNDAFPSVVNAIPRFRLFAIR